MLLEYLRSIKFPQANLLFVPRGVLMFPRKSPRLCSRRCCVTSLGKPTCDWRSWFLCWNAEDVERLAGVVIEALNNYFRWSLRPAMLRRWPAPPDEAEASEHVEERWWKRAIFELVSSFKQYFSTPPAAVPIRLFLWGGAPPRTAPFWPSPHHMIFNLSHKIYTYRPFIRAVIIHYDAKV